MKCPCCGASVDPDDFIVDLNTNTVSFFGKSRRVSPQVAELMFILGRKFPAFARMGEITAGLVGYRDVKEPQTLVRTVVSHARVAGQEIGFEIENIPGLGYRLVIKKTNAVVRAHKYSVSSMRMQ